MFEKPLSDAQKDQSLAKQWSAKNNMSDIETSVTKLSKRLKDYTILRSWPKQEKTQNFYGDLLNVSPILLKLVTPHINYYHLLIHTPQSSCNNVNHFFANIGKNLASVIAPQSSQTASPNPKPATPDSSINTPFSFVLLETDPEEVCSTILSLKSGAATGWDGISSFFLKNTQWLLHLY